MSSRPHGKSPAFRKSSAIHVKNNKKKPKLRQHAQKLPQAQKLSHWLAREDLEGLVGKPPYEKKLRRFLELKVCLEPLLQAPAVLVSKDLGYVAGAPIIAVLQGRHLEQASRSAAPLVRPETTSTEGLSEAAEATLNMTVREMIRSIKRVLVEDEHECHALLQSVSDTWLIGDEKIPVPSSEKWSTMLRDILPVIDNKDLHSVLRHVMREAYGDARLGSMRKTDIPHLSRKYFWDVLNKLVPQPEFGKLLAFVWVRYCKRGTVIVRRNPGL
jgi:hypothetical protein